MQTYILTIDCETCGEPMRNRIGDMSAAPGDEIVIDVAMAVSQSTFNCDACGGITYLGDIEDICEHEAGDLPEDDEATS